MKFTKKHLTILFLFFVKLCSSQIFIIQFDTITHYTCKKNMTIEDMVRTQDFEIVEMFSDPGRIMIDLDMMVLTGANAELTISKVLDKRNSIDIMFGNETRLTIRKSFDLMWVMVIQEVNPKGDKKHIYSFSNVRFIN